MQPFKPFNPVRHFDDSMATRYEKRIRLFCPGYNALHSMLPSLLQSATPELPPQARFLSVGAGTGEEVVTLGGLFPGWEFLAVDLSPEMLALAQKKVTAASMAQRVTFFQGFLQECTTPHLYDAASSIFVAHFIKEPKARLTYFQNIAHRLKPGAPFVVADLFGTPGTPQHEALFAAWHTGYCAHGLAPEQMHKDFLHMQNDVAFLPEETILALLEDAGFTAPVRFYQTLLFGGWLTHKREV
ncbi:class I SAM-dependent methyltransferase [Desulfovibrio cuneatus]|uniref:class I SAM-dependent methyltransferase n=1 Tax=Desulfovibrio cuneatus TaxID=159728 RepID=UPI00040D6E0E|nr:class I SAM-dependent methyltransferase [Desulfovibrio cuneatus]